MIGNAVQGDPDSGQRSAPFGLYARFAKRLIDLILVLLMLPAAALIIVVLALVIRADGGPAFYTQDRVGRGGSVFRLWKLRSMVVDADRRLADLLAHDPAARREWEETQKLRNDPRITPVGLFIRKTSLDELPQIWNVLIGDMSLVGPRPFMPDQRGLYVGREYFELRPGLTGLWQVNDRNGSSFSARAVYDGMYFQTMSFATDIQILRETVSVVMRGTGR